MRLTHKLQYPVRHRKLPLDAGRCTLTLQYENTKQISLEQEAQTPHRRPEDIALAMHLVATRLLSIAEITETYAR